MPTSCDCDVCKALSGLSVGDVSESTVEQLPQGVQRVLRAQFRVKRGTATPEETTLVKEAAARCRGVSFQILHRLQ